MVNGTPTIPDSVRALGLLIDGLAGTMFEGCGMDGGEIEDLLMRAGLIIRRPATEADSQKLYDVEPGDPICELTEFAKRCRQLARDTST